ncbi:MAG TPA: hypothetical protein VJZ76_12165 [Thermoanaerobaculia bacterium]|nr:hypothetical protein [Thermoanaerobaculia bacterium]
MMALLHLLLLTAITIQTPALILRDGVRIDVDGNVRVEQGKVVFRSAGSLYSIPESDVDLVATRAAAAAPVIKADATMRLKVTEAERDRLLRELEQNHSGTPTTATLPPLPPPQPESARTSEDEWRWRRDAQMYEEAIRRAREDLDLLKTKAEQLRAHISGLLSLGYKPNQFTYDSTQLQYALEQIPRAELEVARAERAYAQFKENARKLDVPPGWLR